MSIGTNVAPLRRSESIAPSIDTTLELRPNWITDEIFPFRSRFIEIDAARLHYIDEGTGPTLLFLHGSPMWSFMFRHAIDSLRSRFRCVALDMPGLGLSTAPLERGHAFERNAHYYAEFVRRLDLKDFIAIAHATAGPPCLRMAMEERQRITGLVITNSFAWSMSDFPPMWRFVRVVSSPPFRMAAVYLNLLPRLTTRIARHAGKFNEAERAAILGPYAGKDARRHLANLLYGLRAEVPFFQQLERDLVSLKDVPVLLLYGANDHGYQAGFVSRWQQLLPHNSLVVLENSDHFPQEDEPEAYTDALTRWLAMQVARHGISAIGGRH